MKSPRHVPDEEPSEGTILCASVVILALDVRIQTSAQWNSYFSRFSVQRDEQIENQAAGVPAPDFAQFDPQRDVSLRHVDKGIELRFHRDVEHGTAEIIRGMVVLRAESMSMCSVPEAYQNAVGLIHRLGGKVVGESVAYSVMNADVTFPGGLSLAFLDKHLVQPAGRKRVAMFHADGKLESYWSYQPAETLPHGLPTPVVRLHEIPLHEPENKWITECHNIEKKDAWRLDFALPEPFLRGRGITTATELSKGIDRLWMWLTTEFFSLRRRTKKGTDGLHTFWEWVVPAEDVFRQMQD